MLFRICLLALMCCSLSACSSGGGDVVAQTCTSPCGDDTVEAEKTTSSLPVSGGLSGDLYSADYDEATKILTLTGLGLSAQLNRFEVADFGAMLSTRDATGLHNAYFGEGDGTQIIVYSGGTAGNVLNVAGYQRTGPTELPLTGSAQFNGDYAGFTTTRRINGKAQLNVSFTDDTISGRITDRIFRQRPDNVADVVNPLSMLVLEETSLKTDGSFQGDTGGGQIVNGQLLWNPATGSFSGLIGGATGDEVVGSIVVTHRAPSGGTFDEVGGFLATR